MSFKLTQVRSPNESGLLKRVGRFGFEGLVRLVSMVTRLDDLVQLICPYKRVGSGRMGYTLVQLINTSTIPRVLCHFRIFRIKEKLLFFCLLECLIEIELSHLGAPEVMTRSGLIIVFWVITDL